MKLKRDVFIETGAVVALRSAVTAAKEAGKGFPAMVMATGEAGSGKTWAARELYVTFGGFYLRIHQAMTLPAFMRALCREVTGLTPHGAARCFDTLGEALDGESKPFFVDEPDRLDISCLEALRDIHDLTGCPIVMLGEKGLATRVAARSRINDRIPQSFRVKFGGIGLRDVVFYASEAGGIKLSPEAAEALSKITKGNFRRVDNAIRALFNACEASGNFEVNAATAKAVLKGESA